MDDIRYIKEINNINHYINKEHLVKEYIESIKMFDVRV